MPKGNSMCFTNRQIVNKQTNRKKGFSKQREEKELIENAFGSSTDAKHEPLECDAKKKKKKPATCVVSVKNSEEWQEFITSYLLGVKKKTKKTCAHHSDLFPHSVCSFPWGGGKGPKVGRRWLPGSLRARLRADAATSFGEVVRRAHGKVGRMHSQSEFCRPLRGSPIKTRPRNSEARS